MAEALAAEKAARISIEGDRDAIRREKEGIQRMLDERDRQYAALHAEWVSMRKDRIWRFASMVRRDFRRMLGKSGAA